MARLNYRELAKYDIKKGDSKEEILSKLHEHAQGELDATDFDQLINDVNDAFIMSQSQSTTLKSTKQEMDQVLDNLNDKGYFKFLLLGMLIIQFMLLISLQTNLTGSMYVGLFISYKYRSSFLMLIGIIIVYFSKMELKNDSAKRKLISRKLFLFVGWLTIVSVLVFIPNIKLLVYFCLYLNIATSLLTIILLGRSIFIQRDYIIETKQV